MDNMYRQHLARGAYYHVFNKSISGFKIFQHDKEYRRILTLIQYYQFGGLPSFSNFVKSQESKKEILDDTFYALSNKKEKLVRVLAYCLMPTHFHLIVEQLRENGISIYMGNILNSYTRYFNLKTKRKGPLWQNRFKSVLVSTTDQFLHLSRYLHLNPVTSGIVASPEDWKFSSYCEYVGDFSRQSICNFNHVFDIPADDYKSFVKNRIDYQKELAVIKDLILE